MRMRAAALVTGTLLVVSLVALAPAAGAKSKPKPAKKPPDACKVLTAEEAGAFLGTTVTQSGGGASCDYVGNGGVAAVTITVQTLTPPNVAFTKKQIKTSAGPGATSPKLGDAASESLVTGGGGAIQVMKGKTLLNLSARKADPTGNVVPLDAAAFLALAKTAVGRL